MNRNKLGRNDLCCCGSGKKYKRCCLLEEPKFSQERTTISPIARQRSAERLVSRVKEHIGDAGMILMGGLELKMSGVILDLAAFLLKAAKTKAQHESAIAITCIAWNIAVLGPQHGQKCWDAFCNKTDKFDCKEDIHEIMSVIIAKKRLNYDHIGRVIVDYDLLMNKNDVHLTITSVVPEEELLESDILV